MADKTDKPEAADVGVKTNITPNDLTVARSGPAIYTNRAIINIEHVVRLAFVEQTADGPIFRVAVAMPHEVAISLANALKRSLAEVEKEIEAAKQEAELQKSAAKNG
jgi:hypothetical protein